ncbi:stemmadenine O-acetyltransferase-like isoform X1 [Ipomoea triloba]|uniref:stemmadenine O-acetyltransferase-like isoform X1 n=1 Tax=Ipomoea triloba TaxID=35885 RepID=UPI00125D3A38|nr:stemmadenine O-acetyltransferase-like isoform X1 [Ipomoea triloba]
MVLKLELLSKEMMIKPSSPTPPHLKTLKLSFLDQTSPPFFAPFIFFFHHGTTDDHGRSSQLLKQSLSKVLTLFYPLAGRIKGNDFVDCSDDGALWVEARVHGFLKDVVENPLMEELEKFLPLEPHNGDDSKLMLAVQVNYFLDGGIGVAVCVSHKIGDAFSVVNFVNAWAVTAREGDAAVISPPNFGLVSSLFPPTTEDLTGSGFSSTLGMTTREKIVTRRVVFDKQNLAALKKSAAAESSRVGNPTRVEALSAFLWKRFREASRKKTPHGSVKKTFRATQNVNLRARMNPPLPDATFGNLWSLANTTEKPSETDDDLVFQLRTSIREINAEYVEALQNGKGHSEHLRKWHERFSGEGEAEFLEFTSVCRFPIYEVDFGWGKPVWACITTFPYKNLVILMSTKCGDGIEAWINTGEEDDIYMGAGSLTPTPKL